LPDFGKWKSPRYLDNPHFASFIPYNDTTFNRQKRSSPPDCITPFLFRMQRNIMIDKMAFAALFIG
jgi:hypothetical protein